MPDETLVDPGSWYHDYALISRPGNDLVQLKLLRDYATNSPLYPRVQEYFRASRVPLLAVWGRGDEIFGPAGAQAFAEDLPDAEIHLLDGGHFLLESALDEVAGADAQLPREGPSSRLRLAAGKASQPTSTLALGQISHNPRRSRDSLTKWATRTFKTNNG